jgi:hypothetical protein
MRVESGETGEKVMSILRNGYMAEALAELRRDAGKLWAEPITVRIDDPDVGSVFYFKFIGVGFRFYVTALSGRCGHIEMKPHGEPTVILKFTPARFRAALKRIKTKGRK